MQNRVRRTAVTMSMVLCMVWATNSLPAHGVSLSRAANTTVDASWVNTDIHQAIASVTQQTGAQIIITESTAYKPVTLQGHGIPLAKALRYIALSASADVTRDDDGVYHFRPLMSETPKPRTHDPSEYRYYKVIVQRANPKDILSILGWDYGASPNADDGRNLPDGIDHVYAIQGTPNSVLIHATPEAFARVRDIIKSVDVTPRQVRLKVDLVATFEDVDNFSGGSSNSAPDALALENRLVADGAKTIQTSVLATPNNMPVVIDCSQALLQVAPPQKADETVCQFHVTPRINQDDSITIFWTPDFGKDPNDHLQQPFEWLRTTCDGNTAMLPDFYSPGPHRVPNRIPVIDDLPIIGTAFRSRNRLLYPNLIWFITPTIVDGPDETTLSSKDSANGGFHEYKLVLNRAKAADIIHLMGWDRAMPKIDRFHPFDNFDPTSDWVGRTPRFRPEGVDSVEADPRDPHSLLVHATEAGWTRIREFVDNLNASPRNVRIEVDLVTASIQQLTSDVLRNQGAPRLGESGLAQKHVQLALDGAIITPIATFTATSDTTVPVAFPASTLTYAPKMPDGRSVLELTARVNPDNTITLLPDWDRVYDGEASSARTSEQGQQSASLRTLRTVRSGESMIIGDYAPAYTPDPPPGLMSMSDIERTLSPWRKSTADVGKYILITPTIVDDSEADNAQQQSHQFT